MLYFHVKSIKFNYFYEYIHLLESINFTLDLFILLGQRFDRLMSLSEFASELCGVSQTLIIRLHKQ